MNDRMIAQQVEQELCGLFGETTYRLELRHCTGKYRGHTDYTLVFGSGRRLYVGLDARNYINSLRDHLRDIRHFRDYQEENTRRINAVLKEHDTVFCSAKVEIVPYDSSNDLTLYAAVVLFMSVGVQLVYRTPQMHFFLTGCEREWCSFDNCMEDMLKDFCGKKRCPSVLTA